MSVNVLVQEEYKVVKALEEELLYKPELEGLGG